MIDWKPIFDHIKQEKPREACGVLIEQSSGLRYWPCKNISPEDNQFALDPSDFIRAQLYGKVYAIVHSHLTPEGPSQLDWKQMEGLNTRYIVVCEPTITVYKMEPLKGRKYIWGTHDCFTLISDYYKMELDIDMPRGDFKEFWWKSDEFDYFSDLPKKYGFYEVTDGSLKKNDLLIFNVMSEISNHCGVYMGGGRFLHHALDRLSCEEELHPLWGKYKNKVLRHESLLNG